MGEVASPAVAVGRRRRAADASVSPVKGMEKYRMKPVSDYLFAFAPDTQLRVSYRRCLAKELDLEESWLRDAIFFNPDLVIEPCRAAGLTEDEWYAWQREFQVETGQIDVMLLSSQGRVAIVETKLATNPEIRRRVLAQVLDYLVHLADSFNEKLPEIPKDADGQPVADVEDILESVTQGDILVIVASDEINPRVAKLSQSLLSRHFTQQWDLALIDIALYRPLDGEDEYIVVPHLRNVVQSELRQVVRVVVEGESPRAKVEVERITRDVGSTSRRQKWDEERFFRYLEESSVPQAVRELASRLRDLAHRHPETLTLSWGTGKSGSMVVKRNGGGLIEIYGSGEIRFRPEKFARALGEKAAARYFQKLKDLAPEAMGMNYPRLSPVQSEEIASVLFELIRNTLSDISQG